MSLTGSLEVISPPSTQTPRSLWHLAVSEPTDFPPLHLCLHPVASLSSELINKWESARPLTAVNASATAESPAPGLTDEAVASLQRHSLSCHHGRLPLSFWCSDICVPWVLRNWLQHLNHYHCLLVGLWPDISVCEVSRCRRLSRNPRRSGS